MKSQDNGSEGSNQSCCSGGSCGCSSTRHDEQLNSDQDIGVSFFNYLASMGYQAMIFLGEVPNPITQEVAQNLRQAKFLIDTIALIREKTKGNLNSQEERFINSTLSELQSKYRSLSSQREMI